MPFPLTMPKLSPTMEEGTIAHWHKKEGEKIEAGDLLFEVATDKATVEHNALDEGWLRKILVHDGGSAIVNQPVAVLTEEEGESIEGYQPEGAQPAATHQPSTAAPQAKDTAPQPAKESSGGRVLASPLAKKIAKDKGIDLGALSGTGPNKRIMSRDLVNAKSAGKPSAFSLPAGSVTTEPLTQMRKIIAQRLQEAKATIPHFYVQLPINAQPLIDFRGQLKNLDMHVSVNDCVIKAVALALRSHPAVNRGFSPQDNALINYQTVDVAVAVSVAGGLMTPIVKLADQKPLAEVSAEIKFLAHRAKEGKLTPEEYQGGSFTVSNLGMFGISSFQAIINPPQAAILAVGAILDTPVVRDGCVVPGKIINLTLSVDHRVIDGVAAAQFLNALKTILENPVALVSS